MVSRANTRIAYSFTNTGNVTWSFYTWAYIVSTQYPTEKKMEKTEGPISLTPGQTYSKTFGPETVDLRAGVEYVSVAAVYKESSRTTKLADANSFDMHGEIIMVAGDVSAQITAIHVY